MDPSPRHEAALRAAAVIAACVIGACAGCAETRAPAPPIARRDERVADTATTEPRPSARADAGSGAPERGRVERDDAGAAEPPRDDRVTARGACPDWLPSNHASFDRFRAKGPSAFPKAGASCCALTDRHALCRLGVDANHVVGAASGSHLVGVTEGSDDPWLDVPLRVASHGPMKLPDQELVRLGVTVSDGTVSLALDRGTCPRPCARAANACRGAEADATRACEAIGVYEAGRGRARR